MVDYPRNVVLGHIRGMAAAQRVRESSDAELLAAFAEQRDQAAFAEMVRRHGPLVLRVCRRVLGHLQDAYQATFFLLARNCGSIRKKDSLAEWLHGVAFRTARNARRGTTRRRQHEEKAGTGRPSEPDWEAGWREVQSLLHEEIARLPKAFREVFVLCCLEEHSGAEAARQLGVKEGTVSSRLAKARQLLRRRLARRGVDLSAVLAALALWEGQTPAASVSLASRTVRAVIVAVTDNPAASGAISAGAAALAEGVNGAMFGTQCKVVTLLLLAAGLSAGIVGLGLIPRPPAAAREALPPAAPHTAAAGRPATNKDDSAALVLSGRVLDPAGKAVKDAKLYLLDFAATKAPPKPRTTSDADGRFRFTVARKDVQLPPYTDNRWDHVFLCATAEGHGPALAPVSKPDAAGERTLQLVKDDMPIRGRVLDLQGKPVVGATVRVTGFSMPIKGDLTAFVAALKAGKAGYEVEYKFLTGMDYTGIARLFPTASTDASGRFQLKGIGRERMAAVAISGPAIETRLARVLTRPGETIQRPEFRDFLISPWKLTYYGASFDHVAGPTTPIIGVVRDKDTKKPLAGATVTSWKLAGDNHLGRDYVQTTTDKDGRYRLVGMPRGEGNRIRVMGPEGQSYLEAHKNAPAAGGLESVTVDAELKRGVRIKARAIDKATGKPVVANVEYFPFRDNPYRKDAPGLWPRSSTREDGTFEFIGLPGRAILTARAHNEEYLMSVGADKFKRNAIGQLSDNTGQVLTAPGCHARDWHTLMEIEVAKDAAALTCDIVLDPGRRLQGTVVGQDGKPLSGARLGGARTGFVPTWEYKTQPTVEFTVYGLKNGELRNVLAMHEEKHLAGSLLLKGDEKGTLTLRLEPWGVVTGRLVTSDGQPLPGVDVTMERFGDKLFDPLVGYHMTRFFRTDKNSKFRIEALVPGLKYTMRVMNKGMIAGTVFEDLKVKSGETKDLGDVQSKE
jgi:RNA polymerase sigma factor (sigma-70 family)